MNAENKKHISGYRAVITSAVVSIGDIVISFVIAAITSSSVMFAQGLQGLADFTATVFLLLGVKKSSREASLDHPFGYGRELFFWVLISSLFAFLFSGGLATYRALQQILDTSPIDDVHLAFIALSIGFATNGYSLYTSFKRLSQNTSGNTLLSYIRHSSLVETKMTLLVDLMGTVSAFFGLIALGLYSLTGNAIFDGFGALIIGILTSLGALFVIFDLHDLIVGRSPGPQTINQIKKAALSVDGVQEILDLRASSVGSGQVLALLEVHFADDKTTDEIEQMTDQVKEAVLKAEPQVTHVQVEAETPDSDTIHKSK